MRELHTILRDKTTTTSEFIFYADRLIRLVVEEGLNQLPVEDCTVTTPTSYSLLNVLSQQSISCVDTEYKGVRFAKGNCGVSICRSGESMEKALRETCRSIRIGKVSDVYKRSNNRKHSQILIDSEQNGKKGSAKVLYSRLCHDIGRRRVLLLYPIMCTGSTVYAAVKTIVEAGEPASVSMNATTTHNSGVSEANILLLTLFCTPAALDSVAKNAPNITILTTEISSSIPINFGARYFRAD